MGIENMYLDFFGFDQHPFRHTPDADFLYLSSDLARAKACVEQASVQRGAVVLVTGEIGCGKSVLINRVIAEMPPHIATARLTQTNLDVDEFLQALLSQFDFQPFARSKSALRSLLDNFLFAQSVRGHCVLLIVEEAQNLSRAALREVGELAELEEDGQRLISVVLVGQPGLNDRLGENELRRLAQRARCQVHLEALSERDTTQLIYHRLKIAGCDEPPFESDTYPEIYRYTGGVPRLIISLCDTALTAAYVEDSPKVTLPLLQTAIEELELAAVAEAGEKGTAESAVADEKELHPSLTVAKHGRHVQDLEIVDTRVMIGRDPDNDIVLLSEFISRHHAQISMDLDGRYWIKDLNSTNGIFLNNRRSHGAQLHDGDIVSLGHHTIAFCDPREISAPTPTPKPTPVSDDAPDLRETRVLDEPGDEQDDAPEAQASSGHS